MNPYESSSDGNVPHEDNHSGSRLVLLLFLVPLTIAAGWTGWTVAQRLAVLPLGHEAAQRAGYVGAGLAMLATVLFILRWQQLLSPKAQSFSEEPIDEMSEADDFDRDEDL